MKKHVHVPDEGQPNLSYLWISTKVSHCDMHNMFRLEEDLIIILKFCKK